MSHLHPHRSDDDQIFQKYLDKAIAEINDLTEQMRTCGLCDHDAEFSPVLGTGHPLADMFLVKYTPRASELEEGVAFHGPAGEAILASVRRLDLNPLDLYGTNCIKCSTAPTACQQDRCPTWLRTEIGVVEPKLVVVMGEPALEVMNGLGIEDAAELGARPGEIQRWTHTCELVFCPDIDESLDRPAAKRDFWRAFRSVGEWYADRPPW